MSQQNDVDIPATKQLDAVIHLARLPEDWRRLHHFTIKAVVHDEFNRWLNYELYSSMRSNVEKMQWSRPVHRQYLSTVQLDSSNLWYPHWRITINSGSVEIEVFAAHEKAAFAATRGTLYIYIRKGLRINIKQQRLEVE